MAIAVVEDFELIDVDHYQGQHAASSPGAPEFAIQRCVEVPSVSQARQAVLQSQAFQPKIGGHRLGSCELQRALDLRLLGAVDTDAEHGAGAAISIRLNGAAHPHMADLARWAHRAGRSIEACAVAEGGCRGQADNVAILRVPDGAHRRIADLPAGVGEPKDAKHFVRPVHERLRTILPPMANVGELLAHRQPQVRLRGHHLGFVESAVRFLQHMQRRKVGEARDQRPQLNGGGDRQRGGEHGQITAQPVNRHPKGDDIEHVGGAAGQDEGRKQQGDALEPEIRPAPHGQTQRCGNEEICGGDHQVGARDEPDQPGLPSQAKAVRGERGDGERRAHWAGRSTLPCWRSIEHPPDMIAPLPPRPAATGAASLLP